MDYPKAKKKYGQNFLIDSNILDKIIDLTKPKQKTIIEIGPGTGLLTEPLLMNAKEVHAFEIDDDMIIFLNNKFKNNHNFFLTHNDILKIDLSKYMKEFNLNEVEVIANLPYYISSKIIFNLLQESKITSISIMLQKELVERINAKLRTKDYGRFTVAINTFFDVEDSFIVGKNSFKPVPSVDSAFIKLNRKNIIKDLQEIEQYLDFIKLCFSNRRKQLLNNLKPNELFYNKTKQYIAENTLSITIRAEELSVEEYLRIWEEIRKEI